MQSIKSADKNFIDQITRLLRDIAKSINIFKNDYFCVAPIVHPRKA